MFSNIFGRRKESIQNAAVEPTQPEQDGFVVVGETANDRATVFESQQNRSDLPPAYPVLPRMETNRQISPLEGVPFILNPRFRVSNDAQTIWRDISSSLDSLARHDANQRNNTYNFQLERTVLKEMLNPCRI